MLAYTKQLFLLEKKKDYYFSTMFIILRNLSKLYDLNFLRDIFIKHCICGKIITLVGEVYSIKEDTVVKRN